jgi:REP element-mobilizing transposase RayT
VEFAGAVYHVMCRGDRREAIFRDEGDRLRFLATLAEAQERSGWVLHAYVLMGNHYHLLLETPEANLVGGMRWFQGTYTIRFNLRHRLSGHLFQGRYKALLVDPAEDGYFLQVSSYIHLNPVRAKLLRPGREELREYRWSSYPEYLKPPRKREAILETRRVLSGLYLSDTAGGRRAYTQYMEQRAREAVQRNSKKVLEAEWKPLRRGWVLGSQAFRERMEKRVEAVLAGKARSSFSGGAVRAHDESEARRLLAVGLSALELREVDLKALRKLDLRKQVIAWRVRRQSLVSNRWVAEALHMGHAGNISKVVRFVEEGKEREVKRLKQRILRAEES